MTSTGSFLCTLCDIKFDTSDDLVLHKTNNPDCEQRLMCAWCRKVFISQTNKSRHQRDKCHRIPRENCEICNMNICSSFMEQHKQYCRTQFEKCPICDHWILNTQKNRHILTACSLTVPETRTEKEIFFAALRSELIDMYNQIEEANQKSYACNCNCDSSYYPYA